MLNLLVIVSLATLASPAVATGPVVTPDFQQIPHLGTATVGCQFDAPLADCRVRVLNMESHMDTELDLGRGAASPTVLVNDTHKGDTQLFASFAGPSLANGHCGVRLPRVSAGHYLVICRGRSTAGEWSQGFGFVVPSHAKLLASSNPTPGFILATRGSDVSVLVKTQRVLDNCVIWTPALGWMDLFPGKSTLSNRFRLHGAGPAAGECGITLTKVTEADAGVVRWAGSVGSELILPMTVVAIAAPPTGEPQMVVNDESKLLPGQNVSATCWTTPSVPPANITWLLGGKVIRADAWNATLDQDTARTALPWQPQPARQTLSHLLTSSDLGKKLECRVNHVALSGPRTSGVVLQVNHVLQVAHVTLARPVIPAGPGKEVNDCGKINLAKPLIAGGRNAVVGQFPWHAGIYKQEGQGFIQQCGGSLVSPRLVISAAHCFYDDSAEALKDHSLYRVTLGTTAYAWNSTLDRSTVQRFTVLNLTVSEFYNGAEGNYVHDIAVVRLAKDAVMTRNVGVVCLDWSHAYKQAGKQAMVAGWGATERAHFTDSLKWFELPFVSKTTCRAHLQTIQKVRLYTPDKFCAGFVNKTTSVCTGDSGGGLVVNDATTKRFTLVGIVSIAFEPSKMLSTATCQPELFTGFTAVSTHAEWLRTVLVD